MHTRIPDILLMSTLTLEKLTPEQQRIVEAAIKASIEFEKAAWDKEIEKTVLAAVKDFNVEFYEIDKTLPEAVQPIYDGLKTNRGFTGCINVSRQQKLI